MGSKIDSQMLDIHKQCVKDSSCGESQVTETGAHQLIRRAEVLNNTYTASCYTSSSSRRGNKYLNRLVKQHSGDFTPQSTQMIKSYIKTGHIPTSPRPNMGGSPPSGGMHGSVHPSTPLPNHGGMAHTHGPSTPTSGGHGMGNTGHTHSHTGNSGVINSGTATRPASGGHGSGHAGSVINSGANSGAGNTGASTRPSSGHGANTGVSTRPTSGGHGHAGGGTPVVGGNTGGATRPASGGHAGGTMPPVIGGNTGGGRAPVVGGNTGGGTAPVIGGNTGGGTAPVIGGNTGGGRAPVIGGNTGGGTAPVIGGNTGGGTAPVIGGNTGGGRAPVVGGNTGGGTAPVIGGNTGGGTAPVIGGNTGGGTAPVIGGNPGTNAGITAPSPGSGGSVTPPNPNVPPTPNAGGSVNVPTEPTSPINTGTGSGVVGPHGKEILNFEAQKSTWTCHWFPHQETKAGGDPINNLSAAGGPLSKLDMLTGGSALAYEAQHNAKAFGSGKQYSWWGHCNNAAEAACVLQAPKHDVVMKGANGAEVRFTRHDIQGLLVKVSSGLVNNVDFKGQRYNNAGRDNPNDPAPELFIQVLQDWAKDGLPFVLDIDNKEQVWNFPYDKARIYESDKAPQGFDAGSLPSDGSVKYYHIEMAGTGYDSKKRVYECYIQKKATGNVVASSWIKTPNSHNNADFMWRPHPVGDLMNRASWKLGAKASNPMVDAQVVYDIYMKSIA